MSTTTATPAPSTNSGARPQPHPPHPPHHSESIKDTLISIIIAFTLAFVFRGFVIEAFVIPTGSMAPTLMGAHMRFRGPTTGYTWPVGPWDNQPYASLQRGPGGSPVAVHDPMSGELLDPKRDVPLRSGDRILVLKYLYSVMEPSRFDVVVFKNPTDPSQNYIKRLIGLPDEEIALVDGDVFTRPAAHGPDDPGKSLWAQDGWHIARKPYTQQMAVWQPVFDSSYAPLDGTGSTSPWNTDNKGAWEFSSRDYVYKGKDRTELFFDRTRRRFPGNSPYGVQNHDHWDIEDRYAYDEGPYGGFQIASAMFPVSDVRLRAGIEPAADGLKVEALVRARGMDFQAVLEGSTATLMSRKLLGEAGIAGKWEPLATATITPLTAGHVTDVEFWHSDQALQLFVDGKLVAHSEYDWSPSERIAAATGVELGRLMAENSGKVNPVADSELYRKRAADVRWAFSGASVTLHRVGLDRDLHYTATTASAMRGGQLGLGTSPAAPLRLSHNQFFCCGDNSPQSLDGRWWGAPEQWVAFEFDKSPGVVPRDLMLGKAFFVYWPAPHWNSVPIPDFGRMRFIR